jgi:hypothetical protein
MNEGIFQQREFCDPIRKSKAAGASEADNSREPENLKLNEDDDENCDNDQLCEDEVIVVLEEDAGNFIEYLTQIAIIENWPHPDSRSTVTKIVIPKF